MRSAGLICLGLGVSGLIGSGLGAIMAWAMHDQPRADLRAISRGRRLAAVGGCVIGVALLVAGAVLLLLSLVI